ncbi:hypothetical protein F2Q69_00020375 [Brassica cretica]|uniref:Uncharacterized protein n=1 Tax=Brassica cretica TaxID=69181 RepID=A0A8S9QI57_BRACR|nr:hypothetical protein F2Q69_00020375 [Brassica cretica]
MANEKFGPHLPMIIEARDIETLYELWGIDYAVEIEAPEDCETPETVRPGHYGAYTSHFQDRGLSFPLPRFLLEALAELGMAFAQMAPNFWRYFLASWIRAREEGLRFGLEELKQRFSIRRNSGFPGTMILAPRPGRSIIDGIPNRDDRWREKFFVFKINQALVGDFDIETIHREWSSEIDRIRAAYTLPPGEKRATPVGSVVPIRPGKGRRDKRGGRRRCYPTVLTSLLRSGRGPPLREPNTSTGSVGDRALDDEIDSPTHQSQRRALKEINSVSSNSPSSEPPPPLRASGEGTSQVDPSACFPDRKIREKGCELPSLDDMRERDIYVRMAVANAKVMELRGELETVRATEKQREVEVERLKGKLVAAEAEKVALQTDLDLMKEKHRWDIEGCKATALKERSISRREGGFELDEELERLKDREISLDLDYGVSSVSDPSLSHLDLPEVSGDSVDQE